MWRPLSFDLMQEADVSVSHLSVFTKDICCTMSTNETFDLATQQRHHDDLAARFVAKAATEKVIVSKYVSALRESQE